MNRNELNGSDREQAGINLEPGIESDTRDLPSQRVPSNKQTTIIEPPPQADSPQAYATRVGVKGAAGIEKNKLILLIGGLILAVLFFVFTAVVGHSPGKKKSANQHPVQPQASNQPKGSLTPLMETVRTPAQDNGGRIDANDIERTRSANGGLTQKPPSAKLAASNSLGSVPSFSDTQQKWEEPQPYGTLTAGSPTPSQNALKEPSLIFVRSPQQNQPRGPGTQSQTDTAPVLDLTPGTRIEAKLEVQISSAVQAPVVAVVEYTYALGDRIVVPAGARAYGHLEQANRSGYVSVKFDEIELLDGAREKIDAIGTDLELGPIKGNVFGKNTGRNFLVRTASGLGSVAAMLVGNNSSAAFSEDDMLRERVAENVGEAGDSEVMNMAVNSRVVVSVPADTKIFIVFTRHEQSPAALHRASSGTQ